MNGEINLEVVQVNQQQLANDERLAPGDFLFNTGMNLNRFFK
jgi:hypothetical protein